MLEKLVKCSKSELTTGSCYNYIATKMRRSVVKCSNKKNNETEMLHWAERSGWAHYYLYDISGNLKNQITRGAYHVENAIGINEKSRTMHAAVLCGRRWTCAQCDLPV